MCLVSSEFAPGANLERIIGSARKAGKFVGAGQGPDAELAALQKERGVQWIQAGDDLGFALLALKEFRGKL